jgi:aarF domain-containing kinase
MKGHGRLSKALLFGGAAFTAWAVDKQFYYSTLQRNLYTLYSGVLVAVDVKWNFSASKADQISQLYDRVSKRILNCCKSNGGLYIKFGQQIATVPVLPKEFYANLKELYDQAPVVDIALVNEIFKQDFGREPVEIFSYFNPIPVQSASIAQVHQAVLKNGDCVAVKVQKPAIKHQIHFDLMNYRFLMFAVEKIFDLPVSWTVDYISKHIKQEVDFVSEARNGELCLQHLNEISEFRDKVTVPRIYHDLTSANVLTTEWIEGVSLIEKKSLVENGFNIPNLMQTIVQVFSDQLFRTGFVHCDPHVGNILVRKLNGKEQVVLIDHGLYVQCAPEFTQQYAKFWNSLFAMDTKTTTEIATAWGFPDPALFATATLQRPWKPGNAMDAVPTLQDMYESQVQAKAKVKEFLQESDRMPKELILVGRNLNCVRANNKNLGSPVNRINIMAQYAAKSLVEGHGSWIEKLKFRLKFRISLMVVSITYYISSIQTFLFGAKDFEGKLDDKMAALLKEKLPGFEINENTFVG